MAQNQKRRIKKIERKTLDVQPDFGNFVLPACLDRMCRKQKISIGNRRHENSQSTRKEGILANAEIAPRGFEPLLPG